MENLGFSWWKTLVSAGGKPWFHLVENLGFSWWDILGFSWWKT